MKKYIIFLCLYSCNNVSTNKNVNSDVYQLDSTKTSILPVVDSVAIANIDSFISTKNEIDANKKSFMKLYYATNVKAHENHDVLTIDAKFEGLFNNPKVLVNYPHLGHLVLDKKYSIHLWNPKGDMLFDISRDSLYGHYILYSSKNDFNNLIGLNSIIQQIDIVKNWRYMIIKLLPPENKGDSDFNVK